MPSRGNQQRCEDEHRNGEMEHNAQRGQRQFHDHRPEGDLDAEESERDVGSSAGSGVALYPPPVPPVMDRWGDRLPRRLGLWSAVAVLVGSTIGGGIFRTPAVIAGRVPEPALMLVVWVLGGVLAVCGALTYAELAAMFPRSGGVYVYVREGFGRMPAFLFGWSELLLIRASALGAIATPFAEYLLRSLGLDPTRPPYDGAVHWVAALAIVLTATLNYVGVRWSALLLNVTTAAKYGALALLVLLAFVGGGRKSVVQGQ